jgi:hypothetical protein
MEIKLSDLIARLKVPGLKESNERHVLAEVLTKTLGVAVQPKQITFKEGILTVAVPPVVKSALHIKQTDILERAAKEGVIVRSIR